VFWDIISISKTEPLTDRVQTHFILLLQDKS
jgi:hypothetical protein